KWLRLSCRLRRLARPEEPFAGAGPMVRIRFPPAKSLRTFGPCASRDHPARAAQGSRRFILWLERAVRDEPGYCAGDLCRGSEQRRGGGEPQCCIDRLHVTAQRGSKLDADHPSTGVNLPRRNTGMREITNFPTHVTKVPYKTLPSETEWNLCF